MNFIQWSYPDLVFSSAEILREAALTVSLTFDNTLVDSGPLGINGTGSNFSYIASGRHNQSLSLFGTLSYVRTAGLVLLGTSGQAYSIAIWVNPTVITSGTIVHVSSTESGAPGWCIPVLGFSSTGRIGGHSWNGGIVPLVGPFAVANMWTHVVLTYGSTNGIRLWVNGTQYGSASGAFTYAAAGVPVIATLGSSLSGTGVCATSVITMGQYRGYMDDFQLYSRELSATEISALANS